MRLAAWMPRLIAAVAVILGAFSTPARAASLPPLHAPRPLPATLAFSDANGKTVDIGAFQGKVVVLDYWATWCAPCKAEFPALDRLQERFAGQGLQVVPVSIDRGGRAAVDRFYGETKIANLPEYLDPTSTNAGPLELRGVPTTLILDRHGREVARVEGSVAWDSPEASRFFEQLLNQP
jgi:thiol-disulfide isomerase/thioredoxin